jgi:nucleotide-binding universal stress UspA family protein/CheY-like chemotaxis protein
VTDVAPITTTTANPWLHPLKPSAPPSLSERLIRALEAHASAEAHDLATCEALAEGSSDPVRKLLAGLIVEDEQRHHALLQSMVRRLQQEVEFVTSPTALPVVEEHPGADSQLAAGLRALIVTNTKARATCATLRARKANYTTGCTRCCWKPLRAIRQSTPPSCATCSCGPRAEHGKYGCERVSPRPLGVGSRTRCFVTRKGVSSMFRNTLMVPLDGSEQAERALPYAVRLAAASGARLALVRVALGPPAGGPDWQRRQLPAVEDARDYLLEVAQRLGEGLQVTTATPYGDAPTMLLQTAAELEVDAIVMATHGRTGLDHLLHGSVAEAVAARSPVPVLLVHARSSEVAPRPFDPSSARILVPLDGSSFAEAALPVAVELLGSAGELVLASVAAPPDHIERDDHGRPRAYLDQQEEALKREAVDYLRAIDRQLKQRQPGLRTSFEVRIGEAAAGIVMAETDRGLDLVVISTHGRTGLGRALLGSVAGQVLRTGRAPVVLVGPGAASRESAAAQPSLASA